MIKFNRPTLITVTAPTCSGKNYLLNALTKAGSCRRIVGTTTRQPREGEKEGVDYYFITAERSRQMEEAGEFFELITFNGVRYGVTNAEMTSKMSGAPAPIVILEPQGLVIYEKKCRENGWGIFKIFISVPEAVKLERLLARTAASLLGTTSMTMQRVLTEHQTRVMSITGAERMWHMCSRWDAIVPGDDLEKALHMISAGAAWRAKRDQD